MSGVKVIQWLIPEPLGLDMYFQFEKCFKIGKESLYALFEPKNAFRKKLQKLNFYTVPRSYHLYLEKDALHKNKINTKSFILLR